MKALVIDDEKGIRLALKASLSKLVSNVYIAETGEEGIELFKNKNPELVILDIKLPGIDGFEVLQQIKKASPYCYVIMITYISEIRLAVKAMKLGADDYLTKPFKLEEIKNAIVDIENKESEGSINIKNIVGKNQRLEKYINKVIALINLEQNITVLITGESGTGKELVARAIHYFSKKEDKPFVALNCPSIPKNLQESELFGYEKGAFTDAKAAKAGLLEEAGEGTLFLDEIGDMGASLQATLLRVLQEKKYRRVGGSSELEFRANVICATNKDLIKEIEVGNFRLDLYYRINVVQIHLPALRDRKEDIPGLVQDFIKEYNNRFKKNVKGISPEALKILQSYEWQGNIRELKNVIERIMIFQEDEIISKKDLSDEFQSAVLDNSMRQLDVVEAKTIHYVLEKNNWNFTASSRELGISRLTLRRKIERYKIREM